ncbi:helix-turn-helix domain-containing protein [uncultured Hyphomonas sp.]|jgi:DNA-binding transcriptional regulator YiaG|uniref:helix-turn-helix domain-containing protein n=1 Tax=uncultured Hyphomonas sp. TaxID=225298 RepID=UPI0030D99E12|tara:strand:+ start:23354 stop:23854 length:501 start_codon:yes stop_codon:yes gene_type:complete
MNSEVVRFKHRDCAARSPYQYRECGLSNIWLVSGYEEKEYDGDTYVSIKDVDALHHQIALLLIRQKSDLKGEQVRFLRKEMDLTQAELAALLDVSAQTVARWEKDQTDVPGPVNVLLRIISLGHYTGDVNVISVAQELQRLDEAVDANITLTFDVHGGWKSNHLAA